MNVNCMCIINYTLGKGGLSMDCFCSVYILLCLNNINRIAIILVAKTSKPRIAMFCVYIFNFYFKLHDSKHWRM